MLEIQVFTFNDFSENTYVLYDETKECIIIDPGCYTQDERNELLDFITKKELKPVFLLNTHCHIDHILGNSFCASGFNLPLYLNETELEVYKHAGSWGMMFGLRVDPIPENKRFIKEGDKFKAGNFTLKALLTPGHSPGSITFIIEEEKTLIAGDVLFMESIGRTDLPGGSMSVLMKSIREKLLILQDDFKVYPGHGPDTTIGHEKRYNPFLT